MTRQWLRAQPNFSVLMVDYHDVLNNPELIGVQLRCFLGDHLDLESMLRVPDQALYRQRRDAQAAAGVKY